jgi:hypothetical protein
MYPIAMREIAGGDVEGFHDSIHDITGRYHT